VLNDPERPMKERFRALFTLRSIGGEEAVNQMEQCFGDKSALLKHEVAYCLGQLGDARAVAKLVDVLSDADNQEPIVRHEAGEALGAIGSPDASVLAALKSGCSDAVPEVADTCRLAVARIEYYSSNEGKTEDLSANPYKSTDPAPPFAAKDTSVAALKGIMLDSGESLFRRYRALFSLRNLGTEESVLAVAEGLSCEDNALFRHEVAYVLGQIQSRLSAEALTGRLRDPFELDMVRHECAEALGSVGGKEVEEELARYLDLGIPAVLRESCVVALDMNDYNASKEFQYANSLVSVKAE